MSENNFIKKNEMLYSHSGKASTQKFSYLLDKKSHIDKILAGKKRIKIVETDFIDKEESFDEFNNQINDIEEEDIFTKEYEIKHISDLNDQKLKYFSNVKNPCMYIESKVKRKPKTKYNKNMIKEKKMSNEAKAKEELKKLIHSNNKFNYYYHLLHHTDNSNYFSDEEGNIIIFGPEVNATRYNPKLEYIYPKIIYSPSFKLMSGRYDQQILSKTVKNKIENNKIKNREIERMKRLQKIKEIVNSKADTIYKYPTFYSHKNNEFIKNNERLRELKEMKRSQSLIEDIPRIEDKILGDVEMEKQLQRGIIPEHHDVRIRGEKAFISNLIKGENKTIEQMRNNSNSFKGSIGYDNNTIINEQSLIINKNNSNINNNNSSLNNNDETIYTSNALKNELATLYNTNTHNNESNTNSNINNDKNQINNNASNIELNNKYLTMNINNYNRNLKIQNIFQRNYRKLNFYKYPNKKDPKKTIYTSSSTKNFNIGSIEKSSSENMNKTVGTNLFQKQNITNSNISNNNNNNINNSLNNINQSTIKGVPFDKMLSREYLDNLYYEEEPLHPQVNPKYNFVHPKCIMKVVYAKKTYNNKNVKRFKGLDGEVTFDADKLFYKYNDHFPTKSFYFNKMSGRSTSIDGILPSFMVNLGNRDSCINFNDKSLKLNNFSQGKLKEQRSSFNQHKSFNWKLNMNLLNIKEINKMREENSDINKIYKHIKKANSFKKIRRKKIDIPGQPFMSVSLKKESKNTLPEFYKVNLDIIERNKEYKNKIDGITLKTYINPKDINKILTNRDKQLFLLNSPNI